MKTSFSRSGISALVLSFLAIFVFSACSASKVVFPVSTVLPAAEAKVKVNTDKNNNYTIELEVKNMATPDRLTPARNAYVVWVETAQSGTKNLGQLSINKKLMGSLKTVTPFRPTRVVITAEDNPGTTYPGMHIILQSEYFNVK
jgi:hypothetical protein